MIIYRMSEILPHPKYRPMFIWWLEKNFPSKMLMGFACERKIQSISDLNLKIEIEIGFPQERGI